MTQESRKRIPGGAAPAASAHGGFTLIEVVTVVIIIGILSAYLLTRNADMDGQLQGRLSEVRSQLRYVQLSAMKSGAAYLTMKCDGTNYWAQYANATLLALPGESSTTVSLSGKSIAMTAFELRFDSLGIPYDSTGAKLVNATAITLTANGTNGTISVSAETGFVQ